MLIAVLFFAIVVFGLGHTVLAIARAPREDNPFVGALETAGVGIAAFSFLGVALNFLHVPLRPLAYLAVAAIGPAISLVRRVRSRRDKKDGAEWDNEETLCAIAVEVILILFFMLYRQGANAYPYLEDDDPWMHAEAALYVARQQTFSVDPAVRALGDFAFYLEPYPPTYDVMMGVLRQIHGSVYEVLKFFNVVLVTAALANCYLLARQYLQSARKGLFAVIVLAVLPSFMTHFIWSQSLALCVFPVALYATLRALEDRAWWPVAALMIASLLVTQPVVSIMAGLVMTLLVASLLWNEARGENPDETGGKALALQVVAIGLAGSALSLLFWGTQIAKWGASGILRLKGDELSTKWQNDYALGHYTLSETLFPHPTKIDQATGWGVVVAGALVLGIVVLAVRVRTSWRPVHLLAWFAVLLYVVFAPSLGLPAWGSDRTWAYLAIPVALIAAEGVFGLALLVGRDTPLGPTVILGAVLGMLATSLPAKIEGETSMWPPGQQWPMLRTPDGPASPVLDGFVKMRQMLGPEVRVYSFCGSASRTVGFDMDSSPWVPAEASFRARGGAVTPDEAITFLDAQRYTFFAFDASCQIEWGKPLADAFVDGVGRNPRVKTVLSQTGFILARLTPADGVASASNDR
jgi:hypothetical protein